MSSPARFDRQTRFRPIGSAGQEELEDARVLLVGAGALGGVLAQCLVRAGVGELVLVDRDVVEYSNLPRQVLFEEHHATEALPKPYAAAETLARIGGPTRVLPECAHVDARNIAELAEGAVLLLDGTDNLETRYLLNDYALQNSIPWIYAGVVGGSGLVMPVIPGESACLRCLFPEPPPPGTLPTCDSVGVILPAVGVVASMAAGLALRLLTRKSRRTAEGVDDVFQPSLIELDAWNGATRCLKTPRDPACPACGLGRRDYLHSSQGTEPVVLCGRDTVQLPPMKQRPDLALVAGNLPVGVEEVVRSRSLLRFRVDGMRLTLFRDGRALVEGTSDVGRARAVLDRTVGS